MRGSEVGKKQRHKEKLKFAGLDDSDSSALTQSGDEAEESSPAPHDPSGPGTEVGTEAGEDEGAKMAERSSPGMFHAPSVQGLFVVLHGCLPPAPHRTRASAENHESSESSQEGRIYAYSFGCGHVIL